ncbi:hypothetical protein P7228_02270 [Altererythrobacter arenosus]|uniref:Uncharacterized protein n=1 Tax=Altererythrobacter arenosus TaxID=3032592 RepID=A0ABY8G0V3_9SPHN|nr:hypothetical protein [Altererythrobacter sp. CAU 1644]WFL77914.1 hypothetical protein P7228_02270 [Altererythrobacter sp. CAU 1644]
MNLILSIMMLAALALLIGAFFLWRRTGEAKRPLLMVLLSVIALVNVAIWTLPDASGESPLAKVEAD